MILTVHERILLLQVLPREGNYANMKILNELRMNLSYSEDEQKEWGIDVDDETQTVSWDENGEADIPIGEKATGIVIDELRKLDSENKISIQVLPIYEKFIQTTE
ncbi:hypothetical protein LCGC14_2668100 [marine sediment metagenome]|uniref:Uncharacterized protein n=1 Tax=marine sediment metagenome TaxID=412755 RepID=A0A0F8ZPW5_9ZZZZ